jgi:hypothetical protein
MDYVRIIAGPLKKTFGLLAHMHNYPETASEDS